MRRCASIANSGPEPSPHMTVRFHQLRNWLILAGLALLFLALDQVTKRWVILNLSPGEAWAPIPALSGIFTITHVQNTGVAFGQMPGLGWVFMLVNVTVILAILFYYPRLPAGQWPLRLAAALILAGDLGNMIDRLRTAMAAAQEVSRLWSALSQAYVTDFFDFKVWPVFNVADLFLVSGIIIVAWVLWRTESRQERDAAQPREQVDKA
jgi:signal peptidase II